MKTRKEVAEFINSGKLDEQVTREAKGYWHFGLVDLRLLMDFIYGGEPKEDEKIIKLD